MVITRYKPLFSVTVSYELPALGIKKDGIDLYPVAESIDKIKNLRLTYRNKENKITIYYEGLEQPANAPTTSEPILSIDSDQFFHFCINFSLKEKMRHLKFHSTPSVSKEIGFPVLYDAAVVNPGAVASIVIRDDVRIMPPVFSLVIPVSQTGITSEYASLEIRNEKNIIVDLGISPVGINNKSIDGPTAIPEFLFSFDGSSLSPGIYEFKVGTYIKKLFLATQMDLTRCIALIRVLKNNLLQYKKNLSDNTFTQFDLLIPKV